MKEEGRNFVSSRGETTRLCSCGELFPETLLNLNEFLYKDIICGLEKCCWRTQSVILAIEPAYTSISRSEMISWGLVCCLCPLSLHHSQKGFIRVEMNSTWCIGCFSVDAKVVPQLHNVSFEHILSL